MKKRINEIDEEIVKLSKERDLLQKQGLKEAITLKEKVEIWENSKNLKKIGDLFQCQKYPLLYKRIKNSDYNRYRTIDLVDNLDELIGAIYEGDEISVNDTKLFEEIIKNNIGSVVIDW